MNQTPNYNLGLPLASEKYDVSVFNQNNTIIDSALASKQAKLTAGNNIQISGSTISATNTTYENRSAVSGGVAVSLVTTGEKYVWNNKQDSLTFDSTPTSGSSHPVTSGGVYSALATKANSSSLAAVATSGNYSDLSGVPTFTEITSSEVRSIWANA